jgi:hypothetical protein
VAANRAGSYEERTCSRCFEGRVYDMQRGAWEVCERCSGSGRVVVYLYLKLSAAHSSAGRDPLPAGVLIEGVPVSCVEVGGRSWKFAVALLGAHTTSKNPRPISRMQAYITYLQSGGVLRTSP